MCMYIMCNIIYDSGVIYKIIIIQSYKLYMLFVSYNNVMLCMNFVMIIKNICIYNEMII